MSHIISWVSEGSRKVYNCICSQFQIDWGHIHIQHSCHLDYLKIYYICIWLAINNIWLIEIELQQEILLTKFYIIGCIDDDTWQAHKIASCGMKIVTSYFLIFLVFLRMCYKSILYLEAKILLERGAHMLHILNWDVQL